MNPLLRHALAPAMFGTVPPILLGDRRNLMLSQHDLLLSHPLQTIRPVRNYKSRNPFWSRPVLLLILWRRILLHLPHATCKDRMLPVFD